MFEYNSIMLKLIAKLRLYTFQRLTHLKKSFNLFQLQYILETLAILSLTQ